MGVWKSAFGKVVTIDAKIDRTFGRSIKKRFVTHTANHAAYRFVDLFDAVEAFVATQTRHEKIETDQRMEPLNQLIHAPPPQFANRLIGKADKILWPTGPDRQRYLPIDCFWLCRSVVAADCFAIRLLFHEFSQTSRLELACASGGNGETAVGWIVDRARTHSIYRNQKLHLSHEAAQRDEYGDLQKPDRLQVLFSTLDPVTDEDIVLSEDHLSALKRNVIDIHARRAVLKANGVTTRRGVLLHGPPGTGKTFACRYLSHKLDGVTRIQVAGSSLANVSAVFSFARLLQPAVLFFEDVDLIFAAREISLYSTVLGDLLDNLDGLRSNEDISVVLTTNAIDRLEAAIKDRPGRISQCIYMGPPNAELRRRYLKHSLLDRNCDDVDLDQLVRDSDGGTQAFLKEWINRAVQVACERLPDDRHKAHLKTADFEIALAEMRQFLEGSDGRIIGFLAPTKS